jgi:hypothetical protein
MDGQMIPEWLSQEFQHKYPSWVKVVRTEHGRDAVDGRIMPSLKVKRMGSGEAKYYHFVFEEPFGWAIFSINDVTGELAIQSDWGNYQHRWNTSHLGESHTKHPLPLTHFLAINNDPYYVTDKLHYGTNDREKYSPDLTERSVRQYLLEERRTGNLEREWAREAWDEIKHVDFNSPDGFMYSLNDTYRLKKVLSDEPWDFVKHEASFGYVLLQYKLLPFFFNYLRRAVLKMEL